MPAANMRRRWSVRRSTARAVARRDAVEVLRGPGSSGSSKKDTDGRSSAVGGKVIARGSRADDDRAEREARVAARLNHPSVVALYELGGDEHSLYLVSELVAGRSLAELIAEDALSDRDVARIGAALCDGLAHAHD